MNPEISPNNRTHGALEDDVIVYLAQKRLVWMKRHTYHAEYPGSHERVWSKSFTDRLKTCNCPFAQRIRGSPDICVLHPKLDIGFYCEAKTHLEQSMHDMTLEALPLCFNARESKVGIKCLYTYRDPQRGYDNGFWADDLPKIRSVKIPRVPKNENLFDFIKELSMKFLCCERVDWVKPSQGSNDAFAIIDENLVRVLPNWRERIDYWIEANERTGWSKDTG